MATKKERLDKLFYDIGKQNTQFRLAYTYGDKEEPKFSKWLTYFEAQEKQGFIKQTNQRTQLHNEIILDLDTGDYKALIERLKKDELKFEAYSTDKGRCQQVHLFYSGLAELDKLDREAVREIVIKKYGCDLMFKIDDHMIPLKYDGAIHWKTGQEIKLIENVEGINETEELKVEKETIEREEITLPTQNKLISEFTKEVCSVMVKYNIEIFYKPNEQVLVEVVLIENKKNGKAPKYLGFKTVSGHRFINIVEKRVITGLNIKDKFGGEWFLKKSMTNEVAKIGLCGDVWKDELRHIDRIFTAPLPILYNGELTFTKHGYDERFNSWTPEDTPKIDKDLSIEKAKKTIQKTYAEFCFKSLQDKINAYAHLLSEFCQGLYKSFRTRTPITFWEGNRERCGKDYGADIPGLVMEGIAIQDPPVSTNNKNSNSTEELRKKVTTMLKTGRRRFHSANNRGHIRNEVLEALATTEYWADRLLGGNTEIKLPNEMFISMSANIGFTASPDFINRCRFVRLHLDIEDANKRQFKNPLLHEWILKNRGLILSSLYAFVREWYKAGMPKGKTLFSSYPNWAEIIGGIMVYNELGDPCVADDNTGLTGDKETVNMKSFFECAYARFPEEWKTKRDLINFLIESENLELFPRLKLEDRSGQIRFAFVLEKFVGRILSDIRLVKDTSITRTARQPYRFTKGEEVKDKQTIIGGNGGNVGNDSHAEYIETKNIIESSQTLPTLPTLPKTQEETPKSHNSKVDNPSSMTNPSDTFIEGVVRAKGEQGYPIDQFIKIYSESRLNKLLSEGSLIESRVGYLKLLE